MQPLVHFLDDFLCDLAAVPFQLQALEEVEHQSMAGQRCFEAGASLVRVGVGAPAGLKPDGGVVSGKSGETWDYVSEII